MVVHANSDDSEIDHGSGVQPGHRADAEPRKIRVQLRWLVPSGGGLDSAGRSSAVIVTIVPRMTPRILIPSLALMLLGACKPATETDTPAADEVIAHADLHDQTGKPVGSVSFRSTADGPAISVELHDLPEGVHGFHIHEIANCEGPDFKSAGGHFNPFGATHGHADNNEAHLGDLPNLTVGADGVGKVELVLEGVSLEPAGETSLFAGKGTALVVHADPDDDKTDPAGAAGPRIACGVIERH